jgi:hypothetical protein
MFFFFSTQGLDRQASLDSPTSANPLLKILHPQKIHGTKHMINLSMYPKKE